MKKFDKEYSTQYTPEMKFLLEQGIKDICIYKEKYPESSMAELAEIISTETERPITKSGINHRFRKIKEMCKDN